MNNFSILEWIHAKKVEERCRVCGRFLGYIPCRAAYDTGCLHEAVQAAGGHLPPV